jgi:hypothetical protein
MDGPGRGRLSQNRQLERQPVYNLWIGVQEGSATGASPLITPPARQAKLGEVLIGGSSLPVWTPTWLGEKAARAVAIMESQIYSFYLVKYGARFGPVLVAANSDSA